MVPAPHSLKYRGTTGMLCPPPYPAFPSGCVYTQIVHRNKARRVTQSSNFLKLLEYIGWMWLYLRWEGSGNHQTGKGLYEGGTFFI